MKFLGLLLFLPPLAQASLVATVDARTVLYPTILKCSDTYAAPVNAPSFDRACAVPNFASPSQPAYAEVAAQGPMHIFLTSAGGVSAAGCTPTDGCPATLAQLVYNDVWTVTGGTGEGELLLTPASNFVRGNQYLSTSFQGGPLGNIPTTQFVAFTYGRPFAFSYFVQLISYDQFYGRGTWSLDMSATIESCTGPFPSGCVPATGSVTSQSGDPFFATAPAPLVIIPESATMIVTAVFLGGMLLRPWAV